MKRVQLFKSSASYSVKLTALIMVITVSCYVYYIWVTLLVDNKVNYLLSKQFISVLAFHSI